MHGKILSKAKMSDLKKYTDYKTVLSVNALIWCEGKVLLLKRAATKKVDPGIYSGIGGKVEPGEDFYTAILREIEEETGIKKVFDLRPYSITQHPDPATKAEWVNVYFTCDIENHVEIPETEDGSFEWVDSLETKNLPMVRDLKEYIPVLVKNPKQFILGIYRYDKKGEVADKKVRFFS